MTHQEEMTIAIKERRLYMLGTEPARVKVVVASFMRPRAQYRFALSAL